MQFHYLKKFRRARVEFDSADCASYACTQLHEFLFMGSTIKCYFAQVTNFINDIEMYTRCIRYQYFVNIFNYVVSRKLVPLYFCPQPCQFSKKIFTDRLVSELIMSILSPRPQPRSTDETQITDLGEPRLFTIHHQTSDGTSYLSPVT